MQLPLGTVLKLLRLEEIARKLLRAWGGFEIVEAVACAMAPNARDEIAEAALNDGP